METESSNYRYHRLVEYSEIPARYVDVDVKDGREIQADKGFWFVGPVGTGKTHQAIATLKRFIFAGQGSGYFTTVPDLLENIRRGYDDKEQSDVLEKAYGVGLLVLDDLGVEKPSEWVLEKLYQVINFRYNNLKPMVITGNYSIEKTEELLGQRLVSRLLGFCEVVLLEGEDRRVE